MREPWDGGTAEPCHPPAMDGQGLQQKRSLWKETAGSRAMGQEVDGDGRGGNNPLKKLLSRKCVCEL